jgi:hypothetical protein
MIFQEVLDRLRGQSEGKRKMMIWGITGCVAALLLVWWIPRMQDKVAEYDSSKLQEELDISELQNELEQIPVEIPTFDIPYEQ